MSYSNYTPVRHTPLIMWRDNTWEYVIELRYGSGTTDENKSQQSDEDKKYVITGSYSNSISKSIEKNYNKYSKAEEKKKIGAGDCDISYSVGEQAQENLEITLYNLSAEDRAKIEVSSQGLTAKNIKSEIRYRECSVFVRARNGYKIRQFSRTGLAVSYCYSEGYPTIKTHIVCTGYNLMSERMKQITNDTKSNSNVKLNNTQEVRSKILNSGNREEEKKYTPYNKTIIENVAEQIGLIYKSENNNCPDDYADTKLPMNSSGNPMEVLKMVTGDIERKWWVDNKKELRSQYKDESTAFSILKDELKSFYNAGFKNNKYQENITTGIKRSIDTDDDQLLDFPYYASNNGWSIGFKVFNRIDICINDVVKLNWEDRGVAGGGGISKFNGDYIVSQISHSMVLHYTTPSDIITEFIGTKPFDFTKELKK